MPSEGCRIIEGEIRKIKDALHALEDHIEAGRLRAGLEEFKNALDNARLSIWAILTAGKPAEYPSLLLCFRLHRAEELCRNIRSDIGNGVPATPAELARLRYTLKATLKEIEPAGQA